jgi:hypothetical protein
MKLRSNWAVWNALTSSSFETVPINFNANPVSSGVSLWLAHDSQTATPCLHFFGAPLTLVREKLCPNMDEQRKHFPAKIIKVAPLNTSAGLVEEA